MAKLSEGDKAPSFKALNEKGETVSSADYKGQWLVLYFYPKDMTTGCTQQAKDFAKKMPNFKTKKAAVLGVSADSVESHVKFIKKYGLKFSLLADTEKEMLKDYGVWQKKSMYGREYMGIVRTTFIIDPSGKIQKIYPKVKVNGHAEAVLDFLKDT